MDIQIFDADTLRLKIKKTTFAVDPKAGVAKFDAEAILIMDKSFNSSRINEYRIIIEGPGEYEISGLKVSGIKSDGDTIYGLSSESVGILLAKASSLEKISKDKLGDYKIVIINTDSDLNQTLITAMEPSAVILYGEKKKEGARLLGKENASISSKISISEDKLPEELEIMLLG
ncbi:MAG: hypothetical protein AAB702_01385 [Patescibacteria group bacterium]